MIRHQSAGCLRCSWVAATIGLRPAVAVIAASILTFAQAPTEETRSFLMSSDPRNAVFPAASRLLPYEVQNRVRKFALATVKKGSVGTTVSGPPVTLTPQGRTTSCNPVVTNSPGSATPRSLVDASPNFLPFFNNGPVFGLPGTKEEDFWHRTQLIGDPNCKRSDLARRGIFIDLYSTTAYQHVTSGGLKIANSYFQNTQLSINIDTERAGLWPGGLFHFTVQSRYGSSPDNSFTAGTFSPEYTGLDLPGPFFWQDTLPSDYFLMQSISEKFSVIVGKINGLFIADQTLFGDRFRYYFANSNFNKNPIYSNFFNTTTLAAVGVWTPTPSLIIAGGVHDPHTEPNTLAAHAFQNGEVNLYVESIVTYKAGSLPGQSLVAFNWSNEPKIDLESPFGQLSPADIPQAVNALLGNVSPDGLPTNFRKDSSFVLSNVSQYLAVKEEDPAEIDEKLRTGQPLRGIGVFGRLGYARPEALNMVNRAASVALVARGLLGRRQYDSFGMGFYYNGMSKDLKNSISQLTDGTTVKNENGIEIFYDFGITPAININVGYQHIWNPLTTSVTLNRNHADLLLARLNLVW